MNRSSDPSASPTEVLPVVRIAGCSWSRHAPAVCSALIYPAGIRPEPESGTSSPPGAHRPDMAT